MRACRVAGALGFRFAGCWSEGLGVRGFGLAGFIGFRLTDFRAARHFLGLLVLPSSNLNDSKADALVIQSYWNLDLEFRARNPEP